MNDAAGTTTQWLTQEAHDRLSAELEHLSTTGRAEIAKRIEAARDEGDLKENGGYHAAKDEQGKIEARIRTLTELLRTAVVGVPPTAHGVVEPGTVVTATILGDDERFLLGNREIVGDDSDIDVYSEASPLGQAILGAKIGDTVSYTAPNGKEIAVTIVDVSTYTG
ncbi:transcription elongation factor GreA [Microcella humidisoli]|jgi:transcription elongation factor GreA|uniref:Transcription elongation factor GreA n=1 Tax=Microcella humidisoli TaxID=2963406 RepID=A0ABY5FX85_9MICO|nr:transcription elongation factor GreA [Microcella humidisoli]UTT62918.1 transcription elongation factor GreA [Microcella humidisoli]